MQSELLVWIEAVGSLLLSWPVVGLLTVILFRKPLLQILQQLSSADRWKARLGSFEITKDLRKITEEGSEAVRKLNRLNELMAESRLLELEITESMFGTVFTDDQRKRMAAQIEEFRGLTRSAQNDERAND